MSQIWEIIYYHFETEYIKYFEMDAYCGDKKMIKILNMLHYCGHIMTDADYKEFALPHRIDFEIWERNQLIIHPIIKKGKTKDEKYNE